MLLADFWMWLLALLKSWELLVGGVLTLGLEVANRTLGWKPSRAGWLSVFVILGFFGASFSTWRDEHEKAALRNTGLVGTINQILTAELSHSGIPEGVGSLVELEIRNIGGTPTIVEDYTTMVSCPGDLNATGANYQWPDNNLLQLMASAAHVHLNYFDAGSISYVQTSAHPIAPGSHARGWLYVKFPPVLKSSYVLAKVGCTWTISFKDVHEKTYEVVKTHGPADVGYPTYYPPTN